MWFKMYVRETEIGEIWVNQFDPFHTFLVSFQCTQTHVVLFKEKTRKQRRSTRVERNIWPKKKTDLYGSPPDKGGAFLLVLKRNAPAKREEARRLESFYAMVCAPYQLVRLRHRRRLGIHLLVCHHVIVYFGHGRLNRA